MSRTGSIAMWSIFRGYRAWRGLGEGDVSVWLVDEQLGLGHGARIKPFKWL